MKFFATSKLSENMHETPEGYLICLEVPIARTGEMIYGPEETPIEPGPDGKVIVSREADEVFRPETIASFQGKSITIQHPEDFVQPENWQELTHGIVLNVRRGSGDHANDLIADFQIMSEPAIRLVRDGLREVSCGYEADYIESGVGRGIQKKIIGNHVALVDQGRAGSQYAIKDHKGAKTMTMADKIKKIFGKAQAEALKVATEDAALEKKDEEKTGDEESASLDAIMKKMDAMNEKIDGLTKGKEAGDEEAGVGKADPTEVKAGDEEGSGLEARLKKVEDLLAKLMKGTDDDSENCDDEEEGEVVGDDEEEAEDEDYEMTGDTASRIEILAPGLKAKGKDAKAKALKVAWQTSDGKEVLQKLTGGKTPDFKDEKLVDVLFTASSEVLKSTRTKDFAKSRTTDFDSLLAEPKGAMTAEKLNEINRQHYSKTSH